MEARLGTVISTEGLMNINKTNFNLLYLKPNSLACWKNSIVHVLDIVGRFC